MAKKIEYNMDDNFRCVTPCPFGVKWNNTPKVASVGSVLCVNCQFFVSGNDTVVECNHP